LSEARSPPRLASAPAPASIVSALALRRSDALSSSPPSPSPSAADLRLLDSITANLLIREWAGTRARTQFGAFRRNRPNAGSNAHDRNLRIMRQGCIGSSPFSSVSGDSGSGTGALRRWRSPGMALQPVRQRTRRSRALLRLRSRSLAEVVFGDVRRDRAPLLNSELRGVLHQLSGRRCVRSGVDRCVPASTAALSSAGQRAGARLYRGNNESVGF
jgi:hypothetical protein